MPLEEPDKEDPTESIPTEEIPHTQYKVTSEVTAFTTGELLNGSSDDCHIEREAAATKTHSIGHVPCTEKIELSESNSVNVINNREKEEEEDDELFECHLGSNGQVVLWSSQRETVLSRFIFVLPSDKNNASPPQKSEFPLDSDGDPVVLRKRDLNVKEEVILIEHQNSTTLDLVGEQVWSGALYLADFILHNPEMFTGEHVLELASGVGLTSIVAGMFAKTITITDIDRGEILELIKRNVKRNAHLLSSEVEVKEINFMDHTTIDALQHTLKSVTTILAADVIYDNPLTDAFLASVVRIMSEPPNKTMYLAMEKRYVFTMEDMDAIAPCYEYLLDRLDWLCYQNLSQVEWTVTLLETPCEQYFTYERNKHLIIYKIQSKLKHGHHGV